MECIFCKIADGKIPSRKVKETERSLAFLDAFPLTKGHTLVIPKNHYTKIQEMKKEDNTDLFETVRTMVERVENLGQDRKSTRLNSSHIQKSRMPSSA